MTRMKTDRPIALREAIMSCKNGGTVSIVGVYGGFIDKPIGAVMNRSLRIMTRPVPCAALHEEAARDDTAGDIDPSFVITHHMRLEDAPQAFDMFLHKRDNCEKVVLKTA